LHSRPLIVTAPVSTNIIVHVYSPTILSATVTGAVSYTVASGEVEVVANTNTNGGSFTITLVQSYGAYQFYGALYEDTGNFAGAINCTAYFADSSYETFVVNNGEGSPLNKTFTTSVSYFTFPAQINSSLYRIIVPTTTVIYFYVTPSTPYSYTIWIDDTTGVGQMYIPTSYKLIFTLASSRSYTRQVVTSAGTFRDTLNTGSSYTDVMVLRSVSFSSQVQLAFRHVQIEAASSGGDLVCNYQDERAHTTAFQVWVYNSTGHLVFSDYTTVYAPFSTAVITWSSAAGYNTSLTYRVRMVGAHTDYGNLTQINYVQMAPAYSAPFDLSFLDPSGTHTWLTDLMPYAVIIATGGIFSTLTAPVGIMIMVFMTASMYYMGWIDINENMLILVVVIAILYAMRKRREVIYE